MASQFYTHVTFPYVSIQNICSWEHSSTICAIGARKAVKMGKNDFVWYCAGPWAERPFVRTVIQKLNDAGWSTCSRWAEPDNPDVADDDPEREEKLRIQAIRDIEDVITADGLIYVNTGHKSEGKATELGISIAMLKPIVIVGGRENNIFLNLSIPAFPTTEEAVAWLAGDGQAYIEWVQHNQQCHFEGGSYLPASQEGKIEYQSE